MTWFCSEATTQSITNTLNQGMTTARLQRRPSSNKNVESKLQLSQWEENTCQLKNLQGSRQTMLQPRDRGEENLSSQSRPPALQAERRRSRLNHSGCGWARKMESFYNAKGLAQRREHRWAMSMKRPEQANPRWQKAEEWGWVGRLC